MYDGRARAGKHERLTVFWGFIGGVIAWFATNFIGQPIVAFIAARSEAARAIAQFEYLEDDPERAEREEFPDGVITERRKSMEAAGAQLVAFAHANQLFIPLLRKLKFWPQHAGNALILLSQLTPSGAQNQEIRDQIMRYLRLGRRFGKHRI
jgi:hypothetical protein